MVLSMEKLKGKIAVVTGASSGIGAEIAKMLVKNGMIVIGFARRIELVEKLSEQLRDESGKLHPMKVDITNDDELLEAFKEIELNFKPVHVLVNNAAIFPLGKLSNGSIETWRKIMDTNVLALCIATREAIRLMNEHGVAGHIININSVAGHKVPSMLELNIYPASKFAVTAISESFTKELTNDGSKIRVTSISPGGVLTEIVKEFGVLDQFPLLNPEDIADAVQYVLSTPAHVQIKELTIKPVGEKF